MSKSVGTGLAWALLLAGAGSAFTQQSSGDEYVPTLPAQFLPKEVKSPVYAWSMSLTRWHQLMGEQKPKPKVPPQTTGTKYGGLPGSKFDTSLPSLPGWGSKLLGNGCGECLADKTGPKAAYFSTFVLCPHQLRWSDTWTKLPLLSKGIRLVGPEALAYGNPSLIYALLYVGSQWANAGGKDIRVYAISTKDPIKTYVDNAERTWWFSHLAGIDLSIKETLKKYLRPGASMDKVKDVLANRMTKMSRPYPYLAAYVIDYDQLEDQTHVGGHSVDIQEFVSTRTNLALLKAIGKAKPIASAYIWNAIAAADTSHFIAPPTTSYIPPPPPLITYSPLHVTLQGAGDPMKPIWNEYGDALWRQLCEGLGSYLLETKGYNGWEWQSWGQYYSKNPLQ